MRDPGSDAPPGAGLLSGAPEAESYADALPREPNPAIRQLDAHDLPDELLAAAAVLVARLLPQGAERAALLTLVHGRPGAVRALRQREAARAIESYLAQGFSRQAARERAARAVGVSPWTLRVNWGL